MKCILIDDEKSSRATLKSILEKYCPDVEIVTEAHSVASAYETILLHQPELLFLDVEMHDGNAFDLLHQFNTIDFKIIFTTAYEQYALDAIKVEAVDYLLKPLSINEVVKAVDKLKKKIAKDINKHELYQLLSTLHLPQQTNPYLPMPTANGFEVIHVDEIIRCEAHESYTHIYLSNSVKKVVSKKIGDLQTSLPEYHFFRIHHSHLISRKYIKQYLRGEGGIVQLSDLTELPISRRNKAEFITWLST